MFQTEPLNSENLMGNASLQSYIQKSPCLQDLERTEDHSTVSVHWRSVVGKKGSFMANGMSL